MTPLEYMERQVVKHRLNHDRELARGASEETLENIRKKIGYYEAAAEALQPRSYRYGGRPMRPVVRVNEETGEVVRFKKAKDARESLDIPAGSFGRIVLTNSLRDGYRFYYADEYEGEN